MSERKTLKLNNQKFEIPQCSIYCDKCRTTNFIYEDMKVPYKCDNCGRLLDEADMVEIDLEDLQYEAEEGKYDGEV